MTSSAGDLPIRPARPPRIRLRADAAAAARPRERSGFVVFLVSHLTWIVAGAFVIAHLVLADAAYPVETRILWALPCVIALAEARAYLRSGGHELPIGVWGLAQYYFGFALATLFDVPFYDLAGPVNFSAETRNIAAVVVALGGLCLWGGFRAGLRGGDRLRSFMTRVVPPAELPARWADAFLGYECIALVMQIVLMFTAPPAGLQLLLLISFGPELALAVALAVPSRKLGGRTAGVVAVVTAVMGLLRGMIFPIFRSAATYLAGQWLISRRFAFRIVLFSLALYALLQPVKGHYRRQVWVASDKREDQVSVVGRFEVWGEVVSGALSGELKSNSDETETLMTRVSELGAVMNVVQVVPDRIDYIKGESFLMLLYSPIPRLIWADKPTTQETVQQYAVKFGLQTEMDARNTAINFPLIVEGWWNFGWVGVALVSFLMGLWCGLAQRAFSGDHWAMRALGYTFFAQTMISGAVSQMYASLFQYFVGRLIALWVVYWVAKVMSGRARAAQPFGQRALGLRRAH
jgi:hypothetical protein